VTQLEQLIAEEKALSARRRRLHDRIDFMRSGRAAGGGDTAAQLQSLLDEERQVSTRRRELHAEIDKLVSSAVSAPGR